MLVYMRLYMYVYMCMYMWLDIGAAGVAGAFGAASAAIASGAGSVDGAGACGRSVLGRGPKPAGCRGEKRGRGGDGGRGGVVQRRSLSSPVVPCRPRCRPLVNSCRPLSSLFLKEKRDPFFF